MSDDENDDLAATLGFSSFGATAKGGPASKKRKYNPRTDLAVVAAPGRSNPDAVPFPAPAPTLPSAAHPAPPMPTPTATSPISSLPRHAPTTVHRTALTLPPPSSSASAGPTTYDDDEINLDDNDDHDGAETGGREAGPTTTTGTEGYRAAENGEQFGTSNVVAGEQAAFNAEIPTDAANRPAGLPPKPPPPADRFGHGFTNPSQGLSSRQERGGHQGRHSGVGGAGGRGRGRGGGEGWSGGGHSASGAPWWEGYYDPSFNENPWAALEKKFGLAPRGSWPATSSST